MEHSSNEDDFNRFRKAMTDQIRLDIGTQYPCSQADIDGFRRPMRGDVTCFLTYAEATSSLIDMSYPWGSMTKTQPIMDALRRLQLARKEKTFSPHLIIKAACDIDIAFFGSQLWGNTIIRWEYVPEYPRLTTLYGHTQRHPGGRAVITLNAAIMFKAEDPCEEMWRTMLHEMVVSVRMRYVGNSTAD